MKKEEFKEKAHSVLDEVVEHIAEMEKKASSVSDEMKDEFNKRLKRLKEIKSDLTQKLKDYEGMSESKWDIVKDSFDDFLEKVNKAWKDSYKKASSAFK